MGRSVIGLCAFAGGTAGSFLPALWDGSGLGIASLLFGVAGGVAGVVAGARLSQL